MWINRGLVVAGLVLMPVTYGVWQCPRDDAQLINTWDLRLFCFIAYDSFVINQQEHSCNHSRLKDLSQHHSKMQVWYISKEVVGSFRLLKNTYAFLHYLHVPNNTFQIHMHCSLHKKLSNKLFGRILCCKVIVKICKNHHFWTQFHYPWSPRTNNEG